MAGYKSAPRRKSILSGAKNKEHHDSRLSTSVYEANWRARCNNGVSARNPVKVLSKWPNFKSSQIDLKKIQRWKCRVIPGLSEKIQRVTRKNIGKFDFPGRAGRREYSGHVAVNVNKRDSRAADAVLMSTVDSSFAMKTRINWTRAPSAMHTQAFPHSRQAKNSSADNSSVCLFKCFHSWKTLQIIRKSLQRTFRSVGRNF